jgi:anthranilate phosphoribosyltransferase
MTLPSFPEFLKPLLERRPLPAELLPLAMRALVTGVWGEAETAAFLTALRMKGETGAELAAAARVLREEMVKLPVPTGDVLDTCGTGGDGGGTFNISTAAALVVAGTGVPVVKHGNRAVSSRSGSADVLEELGVPVEAGPAWAARCLREVGLAFCFAPQYHPTLAKVAAVRRRLGVRTLLNLLGPLANPAGAAYQLLGVRRADLLEPLADAVARLSTRQTLLVCGSDGLGEVSLGAPTLVRRVRGSEIDNLEWSPTDFGLGPVDPARLRADGPAESAALVRSVLANEPSPARAVVLANAAAALMAAERVADLREGVARAEESLADGRARRILEGLQSRSTDN